jgi:hypothetical protein
MAEKLLMQHIFQRCKVTEIQLIPRCVMGANVTAETVVAYLHQAWLVMGERLMPLIQPERRGLGRRPLCTRRIGQVA